MCCGHKIDWRGGTGYGGAADPSLAVSKYAASCATDAMRSHRCRVDRLHWRPSLRAKGAWMARSTGRSSGHNAPPRVICALVVSTRLESRFRPARKKHLGTARLDAVRDPTQPVDMNRLPHSGALLAVNRPDRLARRRPARQGDALPPLDHLSRKPSPWNRKWLTERGLSGRLQIAWFSSL